MGYLLDQVQKWRTFLENYGDPQEVDIETARQADQHKVWTYWSRGSDFLSNELVESDEVVGYFVTPRQWTAESGSLTFVETEWVDCPTCEENEEDDDWDPDSCEECEGSGNFSIYIPDCLDAKTEEEVLAMRELS